MTCTFEHKEGLEFLSGLPDESVDLVLTDPPYITSRDSGMDKWVDHVAAQDASDTLLKTVEEWEALSTGMDWISSSVTKKEISTHSRTTT